jgi:hypothetical protein
MAKFYPHINNFQNERLAFETDRLIFETDRATRLGDEVSEWQRIYGEVYSDLQTNFNPGGSNHIEPWAVMIQPKMFLNLELEEKLASIEANYFSTIENRVNEKIEGERLPGLQNELQNGPPSLSHLQKLTLNLLKTTIGLLEKTINDRNGNLYR